ncbi:IS3 family transposase [Intestinibacter bartlettii]|uniref:IS3 family transposase n=1 Tax=Intestinibacter bartlettii TaxID=261299 RepID=UPI0011CA5CB5|nr:IS3 family transposase [Intestinibacter bartlettii]
MYRRDIFKGMYLQERYATIEEIAGNVFEYVELFYYGKRIHCILGYMSFIKYRLINYS